MNHRPSSTVRRVAKEASRALRKSQTRAEEALWERLRNRQLSGLKFLRQHVIYTTDATREGFFIADFYCSEHRLLIEVDGPIHERRREADQNRDEILQERGIRILRFRNADIEQELDFVLARIVKAVNSPPSPLSWKERGNKKIQ